MNEPDKTRHGTRANSDRILDMSVVITPALAVDGEVKSSGQVLDAAQIKKILTGE